MIASLRETKTKLSEMVTLAEKGEDILITVRGKPKARLTRVTATTKPMMASWRKELEALHVKYGTRSPKLTAESILHELREERS